MSACERAADDNARAGGLAETSRQQSVGPIAVVHLEVPEDATHGKTFVHPHAASVPVLPRHRGVATKPRTTPGGHFRSLGFP